MGLRTTDNTFISQFIVTAQEDALPSGVAELARLAELAEKPNFLGDGVAFVCLNLNEADAIRAVRERPPIFLRHMHPVHAQLRLSEDKTDLDAMVQALPELLKNYVKGKTFSVQSRIIGAAIPAYQRFDINEAVSKAVCEGGGELDVRKPYQALSVTISAGMAYMGLSPVVHNISDWAGGNRRFSREEGQISRAEFKLLEAIEAFGLNLPASGVAADLGAAPGGWTRVLLERGLRVIAVDPAPLDDRLSSNPNVTQMRLTAQAYLPTAPMFDVIVNDMKMDARDSARVMLDAAKKLNPGGIAVITLKLPRQNAHEVVRQALRILSAGYEVIGTRQLFHNRQEATCALRKR